MPPAVSRGRLLEIHILSPPQFRPSNTLDPKLLFAIVLGDQPPWREAFSFAIDDFALPAGLAGFS